MIDTSSFETSVVISEIAPNGDIHVVDFKDDQGNTVDNYKYRLRKPKTNEVNQQ